MPLLELSARDAAEVHRFVARRVANHADAADIAQQTLLQACAKRSSCRGEVSAWLFAIARNLIVDHYRTKQRFRFLDVGPDDVADQQPKLQTPRDAVTRAWECRSRLEGWLESITRGLLLDEQIALLLADVYGHRDKDSAARLEMSLASFKLLLHVARVRARALASGYDTANGRRGVGCRLEEPQLLALRADLFEGLSLLMGGTIRLPSQGADSRQPTAASA